MSDRNIGLEILNGIKEIKVFKEGKADLVTRVLSEPSHPKEIRARLNLSQSAFAGLMGVSVRTAQDWEQDRREPSGPAKSLLRIAEQHPDVFLDIA
ncbi:MAG: helix-turn-helix domain-containing protein [Chloroflexi bacterium]|nr:helix-turn-helix domain-containing protein [Chloroflexota bacterium]